MAALAGTLEVVSHPLAAALADGAADYAKTNDPLAIEIRLDRGYAEHALRETRGPGAGVLREMLTDEIDAVNVKTALRLAQAAAAPSGPTLGKEDRLRFFIPGGGRVDERLFLALSSDQAQAQAWARLRAQGFPVKALPQDLIAFEREFDVRMANALAARYVAGDPLGPDIVIGYLAMKSAEVANLRLIARAKFLGLAREVTRRELVLV
jgi:vacuolar-type H+-ATPase subunit C/Vma6